jgi:hypothetical protein
MVTRPGDKNLQTGGESSWKGQKRRDNCAAKRQCAGLHLVHRPCFVTVEERRGASYGGRTVQRATRLAAHANFTLTKVARTFSATATTSAQRSRHIGRAHLHRKHGEAYPPGDIQ